jgi:peptidoglycan/xylan/chitin deacetylase (PgdA/CDA1 family)
MLADERRTLFFDATEQITYDSEDYSYARTPIFYNNTIYIPARFAAEYFGMSYYYDYTVPVVRIRSSSGRFEDTELISTFRNTFIQREEEYVAQEVKDPATSDPAPAYLMFAGELNEYTEEILDILKERGQGAAFFVSSEQALAREDILRRIYVAGHMIGIAPMSGMPNSPQELTDAYKAGADAVFRILRVKPGAVYVPGGSANELYTAEYLDAVYNSGFNIWDLTIIAPDFAENAVGTDVSDSVIMSLIATEETQTIAMHSTAAGAEALPQILDYITLREGTVLTPGELVKPVRAGA